jgi:hypothetical protein
VWEYDESWRQTITDSNKTIYLDTDVLKLPLNAVFFAYLYGITLHKF